MPSRNSRKEYFAGAVYHIYNRGVEKRDIFLDEQDYNVFLKYLSSYILPIDDLLDINKRVSVNLYGRLELYAFCLMPNHFHLLVKQEDEHAVKELMHSLLTRYTMYFNKKYKRVGSLFQGRFKAANVINDEYLIHLVRYIHLNPRGTDWKHVSSPYYLGNKTADWMNTFFVLSLFEDKDGYIVFMDDKELDSESLLGRDVLDED